MHCESTRAGILHPFLCQNKRLGRLASQCNHSHAKLCSPCLPLMSMSQVGCSDPQGRPFLASECFKSNPFAHEAFLACEASHSLVRPEWLSEMRACSRGIKHIIYYILITCQISILSSTQDHPSMPGWSKTASTTTFKEHPTRLLLQHLRLL